MAVRKCIFLLFITLLTLIGSTAAWLYLGESPRKSPIRAKQVYLLPISEKFIAQQMITWHNERVN